MGFARFVRDARHAAGLTQEQLGEAIGFDQTTVSLIETGKTRRPSDAVLAALAGALGVPRVRLYEELGLVEPPPACGESAPPADAVALVEALPFGAADRAWLAALRAELGPERYRLVCADLAAAAALLVSVAARVHDGAGRDQA